MCLRFVPGCRLCKSWAGASSQPGRQTRKQMDLFGLNPSHATSSSWPSSSTARPLCRMEGNRGWACVCDLWGMVGILMRGSHRETVCADLCLHMATSSMPKLLVCCLSLPLPAALQHFAVCSLSQTSTLCFFLNPITEVRRTGVRVPREIHSLLIYFVFCRTTFWFLSFWMRIVV